MRITSLLLAVTLPLVACVNDWGSRPLYGTWGGESGLVLATPTGMSISTVCGLVALSTNAVAVDGAGRFSVVGELHGFDNSSRDTLPLPPVLPARITGTVAGDRIMGSIEFTAGVRADTLPFSGVRGKPAPEPMFCI